jgi:hypothetical protein
VRAQRAGDGLVRGEWLSAERADRGVILYLHGGGYVACSPSTHRAITAALVRLAGRRVFALDYRLSPEHRFPAALDDAVAAYRWLLGACRRNHDREKKWDGKTAGAISFTGLRPRRRHQESRSGTADSSDHRFRHFSDTLLVRWNVLGGFEGFVLAEEEFLLAIGLGPVGDQA